MRTPSLEVQPSLEVGRPDDPLERQAEAIAELAGRELPHASGGRAPPVQRQCAACAAGLPCAECDARDRLLASREGTGGPPRLSGVHAEAVTRSRGRGDGLDGRMRAHFEPFFGRDLGHVRLHTDPPARGAARAIGARAFTHGADIFFGTGRPAMESTAGRRLLAHELTHVVQQGATGVRRDPDPTADSGDFDPCALDVGGLTNEGLVRAWDRATSYLRGRSRGADRYYDYANLERRVSEERNRRIRLGHLWLAGDRPRMPHTLYELKPVGTDGVAVLPGDVGQASGAPDGLGGSYLMLQSQLDDFLARNGVRRVDPETLSEELRSTIDPSQVIVEPIPPAPPPGAAPGPFHDPFGLGTGGLGGFPSDPAFGGIAYPPGFGGSPDPRAPHIAPLGMVGTTAGGLHMSPFDFYARSAVARQIYGPQLNMQNPDAVRGAELYWRGALPEISLRSGGWFDPLRVTDLNAVRPNFPVFDFRTPAGDLISVTHVIPDAAGNVDVSHALQKVRAMSGGVGSGTMTQSIDALNQHYDTTLTVADVNTRNYLAVPADQVQAVRDSLDRAIGGKGARPNAYANLLDGLLGQNPITVNGQTFTSWQQVRDAQAARTISAAEYADIRRTLGTAARARVIPTPHTVPEMLALQNLRARTQALSAPDFSLVASPELLEMHRAMGRGMSPAQARAHVAHASAGRSAAMGTGITVLMGGAQWAVQSGDPEVLGRMAVTELAPSALGAYSTTYLETRMSMAMGQSLVTQASSATGAGTSRLGLAALGGRSLAAGGATVVVAPIVTLGSMAIDEAVFGAEYTYIDYTARGVRTGVSAGTSALVGTGASAGATALTLALGGAAAGSWAPGVGTAIGFIVGLGVFFAMEAYAGDAVEGGVREALGEQGCVPRPATVQRPMYIGGCFPGHARVRMATGGTRAISSLGPGARVTAFNELSGAIEACDVARLIPHPPLPSLRIGIDAIRWLDVTHNHPVGVPSGWKAAGDLRVGDRVLTFDPEANEIRAGRVTSIDPRPAAGPVYELSVEKRHTHFVEDVLVHNKM